MPSLGYAPPRPQFLPTMPPQMAVTEGSLAGLPFQKLGGGGKAEVA